jgi:hypothetical protein
MVSIPEEDCDLLSRESGKMVKSACRLRKKTFFSQLSGRGKVGNRRKR